MPIYAYKCSACGFAKDALQKISDPLLTKCPECGQETFSKQVTAAGFQLKGSGWYVTDFRNNGSAPATGAASSRKAESENKGNGGNDASSSSSSAAESSNNAAKPSTDKASSDKPSAAPAAAPAAGTAKPSGTPSASA